MTNNQKNQKNQKNNQNGEGVCGHARDTPTKIPLATPHGKTDFCGCGAGGGRGCTCD